ncbi:MAG: ATP synthase F0 subunit A [Bacillota bacterium]|jgi:F-type H+-transporting ATPase subunit a|nr:MAG: ATP synthase F0 subunit A [Bacillota bacterium]
MAAIASEVGEEAASHGPHVFFRLPFLGLEVTSIETTMWGIMLIVLVAAWLGTRTLGRVPRSRGQALLEVAVDGLRAFFAPIIGEENARAFLPFLGSLFIFILLSNYSGLLPGAGHLPGLAAPTSNWGVTAGLAAVVFVAVQYVGVKKRGLAYFKHMVNPWYLAPLLLPLGVVEEFVRPFALSLRLVANIFGGETVVLALLAATPWFLPIVPLGLELIFGFIQAFIFTFLTAIYLATAVAEEH